MRKLIVVVSVLVLIASCMKEKYFIESSAQPLSIVPSINMEEATAFDLYDLFDKYQIGIQVTNPSGTLLYYTYTKNIKLAKSDKWSLSTPVCISGLKAKIYAYYPYSATKSDLTGIGETAQLNINIPAIQNMKDQVDFLYASQDKHLPEGGSDIVNINPNVSLRLDHSLALVSFVIYKDAYTGAGVLTQIKIKDNTSSSNLKVNKSGINDLKMNLSDGAITGGEPSATIVINSIDNTIKETSNPGTDANVLKSKINGYALVIPATFADKTKVQFTFTIDGEIFTASLTDTGALSWVKGKQYIYVIQLSRPLPIVVNVTITDWSLINGGEVLIR